MNHNCLSQAAKPDVLGDTHNRRVWTRVGLHSHQFPGKARAVFDDAYAGTLWFNGLDSTGDRESKAHFIWSECALTFLVTGATWVLAGLKSF